MKENLGYSFITFSNSDEARQAMILTHGKKMVHRAIADICIKGNLDHSDLDKLYALKKLKNDSKLVDYQEELRQAKKNLRDFERDMDSQMPSLRKLKAFREIAQELIENPDNVTGQSAPNRRFRREREQLVQKLKKFQKEHPEVDITQLFENEKTDRIRRQLHKVAF